MHTYSENLGIAYQIRDDLDDLGELVRALAVELGDAGHPAAGVPGAARDADAQRQGRRRQRGEARAALLADAALRAARSEVAVHALVVDAKGLWGGDVHIDGSVSSQFLTAFLMAAPMAAMTMRRLTSSSRWRILPAEARRVV